MSPTSPGPRYTLSFTEPHAHLVDIVLRLGRRSGPVELWMPAWSPGSYLIREYSRHVESFTAETAEGGLLSWTKTAKNTWRVEAGTNEDVVVRYRVYGREMSVRTNWIDDHFAFLVGSATFLTVRGEENRPHRVTIQVPTAWAGAWSGLGPLSDSRSPIERGRPGADGTVAYEADDLDELIDCPILAGTPALYPFEVDGVPFVLLNEGEGGLWDGERAAQDVAAIVKGYRDMYGGLPFDRYYFLNLITERGGGLEHKNSCVMMASRNAFRDRATYADWLGLASHEFFHVWNVKRSRPVELGPFDYENEVYTRNLWVAEGITSYYTNLVPCRVGVTTTEEYLGFMSRMINRLMTVPGRALQSLEESSFDTWIKLYRPDENTGNTTISYYTKGAIVAWLLDARIQRLTAGERTLDDLMRLLFERHSGERGFTSEELRAAAAEVAGESLEAFFAHTVASREELDFTEALDWFGLRFKDPYEGLGETPPTVWLGLETTTADGRVVIKSVYRDGPGWIAGLDAEDEILALGGYRVTRANFEAQLRQRRPEERVELLVSRRDAVLTVPVVPVKHPGKPWRLMADPEASPEAAARRERWWGKTGA